MFYHIKKIWREFDRKRRRRGLTKAQWAKSEYGEALFTATRGPEGWPINSLSLKSCTTGRVRAFITDWEYGSRNLFPLERSEQIKRNGDLLEPGNCHFRNHYHGAVDAIRKECGYDLIEEKEWLGD